MTDPVGLRRLPGWALLLACALSACTSAPSAPGPSATLSVTAVAPEQVNVASPCVSAGATTSELANLARVGPSSGVWVGMNLDWGSETIAGVAGQLDHPPATVVTFVSFPLTVADTTDLDLAARQTHDAEAVLIVTLQPWGGLSTVTDGGIADLARRLSRYGAEGVPTIIRFAHEMNGSWYPWSQDPAAYIAAFRRVADAIHATAPTAAMVWAPNEGEGYPYAGGKHGAAAGTAAARALDTNGDGRLGPGDDPYAPYWPGASYVDWVAMSLYHWGATYPWGANTLPATGKFHKLITGSPSSEGASVPDFYTGYAERYDKPLAIMETAAFYRPGGGGATESAIKTAWLAQVFSADTRSTFPLLRMVNWFEWRKFETEVTATVDWRVATDPMTRAAFLAAMTDGFSLGPAIRRSAPPAGCSAR